jgi:hypothetical protein
MNTPGQAGAATIVKTSAPTASATARKRHDRETRCFEVWRKELATISEANLIHLDALTHGFIPADIRRWTRFQPTLSRSKWRHP